MEFLQIPEGTERLAEQAELLKHAFPHTDIFTTAYLKWLYVDNPEGPAVGFDGFDGDRLVAHYVCLPARAEIEGKEVRVLLSLNTACHENYRRRGLFTKLMKRTYDLGRELGFQAVYGVANANSTPGMVRKLNFQHVCQLDALVGVGSPVPNRIQCGSKVAFRKRWPQETLSWRLKNPVNPVRASLGTDRATFSAPALLAGYCRVVTELPINALLDAKVGGHGLLRLFIGKTPAEVSYSPYYIPIPKYFWPSPLNMIYLNLLNEEHRLEESRIEFNFMDFDAY